jgi:hypothetical protein
MLRLWFICLFFFSSMAGAVESVDVSARYGELVTGKKNATATLAKLDLFFKSQLHSVLKSRGEAAPSSLAWLDRIYSQSNKKQMVLVKTGLRLSGKISANQIYKQGRGYLIHLPLSTATGKNEIDKSETVALLFLGYQKNLVESLSHQLRKNLKLPEKNSTADFSWDLLGIPYARAEMVDDHTYCTVNGKAPVPPTQDTMNVMQDAWGCLQGVGAGLWDASFGTLQMAWDGMGYLFTHWPTDTWNTMSAQAAEIGNLVQNFPQVMGQFQSAFNELPSDVRAKVLCEVITSIGAPTLFAILTGGAATPALMVKIAAAFKKVATALGNPQALQIAEDFSHYIEAHPVDLSIKKIPSLKHYKGLDVLQEAATVREAALAAKILAAKRLDAFLDTFPSGPQGVARWNAQLENLKQEALAANARFAAAEARVAAAKAKVVVENDIPVDILNKAIEEASRQVGPPTMTLSFACLIAQRLTEHLPGAEAGDVNQ